MVLSMRMQRRTMLLAVIMGVFLLSMGYLVNTLVRLADRQVIERNLQTLDYGTKRIENHIGKIEAVLSMVKYDPREAVVAQEVTRDLHHLLRDYPEVQDVWIASPARRIVYATHATIIGLDLADLEAFYQAESGKKSIMTSSTNAQWIGKPHIAIIVPLFRGTEFCGVIGASIDFHRFNEMLQDIVQHENNMVLTILDKEGTVIASSHAQAAPGRQLAVSWPVAEVLRGEAGYTREHSPVFQDERLYVYRPSLDARWAIVMSQPVTDVYAPWMPMLRDAILPMILCMVLLVGLIHQVLKLENMRRIEALEYQAEKAHAVAELAASVAHEIRNPLTAIRGFMQLLSSRGTDAKAHEYAQLIVEEVDNLEVIVGEFLNLAKPHAIKQEKCDLYHVLRSVNMLAQGRAVFNGVYVVCDVAEGCIVLGDGIQLKQAFLNLCANAIQAMPNGGKLSIAAGCVEDNVVVIIKDTGQGIPPHHLKRLGERFFTTKKNGTGIGLAVTYRIVRKHRGKISVVSSLGEGTKFTVVLPSWVEAGG